RRARGRPPPPQPKGEGWPEERASPKADPHGGARPVPESEAPPSRGQQRVGPTGSRGGGPPVPGPTGRRGGRPLEGGLFLGGRRPGEGADPHHPAYERSSRGDPEAPDRWESDPQTGVAPGGTRGRK
ncbi:hypothetical protein M9458_050844, partial [Cirrhinus mrigala]